MGGERFDVGGTSHAQTHYLLDAKWEHHHLYLPQLMRLLIERANV
jgi:hypothetical protein